MAIYLPGVQDYIPQLEVFTPDYKFMSDILDVRTDRYTTNYNQLNDIYGKVVYADLSRADNKAKRDQYADQLAPRLQQISGLDLSLQQNVDAAKGLFKPFYSDDNILKDIVHTKTYREGKQKAEYLRDSVKDEDRERYSEINVRGMDYMMEEYINASPEEAMKMPMPRYVPDSDLIQRGIEALGNMYGEGKGMTLTATTKEGDYLVTTKNGALLTRQPYIKADGTTGYINPAKNYIAQALMDDPVVRDDYWMKAYVEGKDWAKTHADEYGGDEKKAQTAWAQNQVDKYKVKQNKQLSETSTVLNHTAGSVKDWDKYISRDGKLIPGSMEELTYKEQVELLTILEATKKMQIKKIVRQTSLPTSDQDLLNKAYQSVFARDIDGDLTRSAINYSSIDAERTFKADPLAVKEHAHIYNMKEKQAQYEMDIDKMYRKAQIDEDLARKKGDLVNEPGGSGVSFGADGYTIIQGQPGTTATTIEDGEVVTTPEYTQENKDFFTGLSAGITTDKFSIIKQLAQAKSSGLGLSASSFDMKSSLGDKNFKTWDEAQEYLLDPANSEQLNEQYNTAINTMSDATKTMPTIVGEPLQASINKLQGEITTKQVMYNTAHDKWKEDQNVFMREYIQSGHSGHNSNVKKGYSPLYMTNGQMSLLSKGGMKYKDIADIKDNTLWTEEDYKEEEAELRKDYKEVRGTDPTEDWVAKRMKMFRETSEATNKLKTEKKIITKKQYADIFAAQAEQFGNGQEEGIYRPFWNYMTQTQSKANKRGQNVGSYSASEITDLRAAIGSAGGVSSYQTDRATGNVDYTQGRFDRAKAVAFAEEKYDKELEGLEEYMASGKRVPFDAAAYAGGRAQQDMGTITYPGYQVEYDHATKNPVALEQLNNMFKAVNDLPGKSIIKINAGQLTDKTTDPKARQVANMLQSDLKYRYKKADDAKGHPQLSITYHQKLGEETYEKQDGSVGHYAGYIVTLKEDYADQWKSTRATSPNNNLFEMESWNSNSFTVFVKEEDDYNNMKAENQRFSKADAQITYDGNVTSDSTYYPGGGYNIWAEQKGNQRLYYQDVWTYGYNDKTGDFQKEQMIPPSVIAIEGAAISRNMLDVYIGQLEGELSAMKVNQIGNQKKNKKSTNAEETN